MSSTSPVRRSDRLTYRPQVSRAARELIRFIHMKNLKPGDRLPAQPELAKQIAFSNDTLSEAMKMLVAGGILTRRQRVGTLVADPTRPIKGLWRVGITVFSVISSQPFWGQLLQGLQTQLYAAGCNSVLHMLAPGATPRPPNLADFGAIEEEIRDEVISGIISLSDIALPEWRRRDLRNIPMCHVGAWEDAPCGVVIDQGTMAEQGVSVLVKRGCRRLAFVGMGTPDPGYRRGAERYLEAVGQAGLGKASLRQIWKGEGAHAGVAVAEDLLAMSPDDRPDGLVVNNDWVGMGLAARLSSSAGYRPQVAVMTNAQAPLAFALPVIHFEVDVEQLARCAVEILLERMRNPQVRARREWLAPELSAGEPRQALGVLSGQNLLLS